MSGPIRSFVAFEIDNESVLKQLTQVQRLLAETGADLKTVEPENIHISIRFLGNIAATAVDKIYDNMRKIQFVPFDVKVWGLGAFPDARYPRVVWAGLTEGSDELRGIFTQLEPHLLSMGFAPDPKGFSPHLTIARVRSGRNKAELVKLIMENKNYQFGTLRAACLRLKKSELTSRGPIYSTLREFCPEA